MADEVVGTAWVPQEGVSLEPAPQEDLAAIAAREAELIASARKKRYAKDRTEAETKTFKKYQTAKQHQTRARKAARKETFNSAYDGAAVSKADAKQILSERQIQHPHVLATCVALAEAAAKHFKIPFNAHLLRCGLRDTLQAIEKKQDAEPVNIPPEVIDAEVIHHTDAYALWDYGFWRQPDVTFEQWLQDRRKYKSSAFETSKLLGKEDFGSKHEEWTAFAPRWNPEGLRPNYTQREALAWLDAQRSDTEGDTKRYLLVASRNSMKSTFARIHALCLTLICPDSSILIISETNKLSKKAIKEFKGYLELLPDNPTLFQQYFPEYAVPVGDSAQQIYENPLAHLGLPQSACESSSMESANTGSRFWYAIFDDPISRDNGTSNEEQKAAALSKFGSISRLREPAGYILNIQTPWVPGDLGDTMIERNKQDAEHPLAVRIDPVFEVKPEARRKALLDLTEDDVVLNFLPKLNWRFVRDEMRSPEGITFFKTQYLCQWVEEEDGLKCQFDHDELWARVRPSAFFGDSSVAQTWMVLDRAYGTGKYCDLSALIVGKIQPVEGRDALVISHCFMERLKESDLVKKIVDLIAAHHPQLFIAERDKSWEALWQAIIRGCGLKSIPCPSFRWINIDNTERAFARRAKAMELPISDGRLWFANAYPQLEQLLLQLERFDGRKRSGSSLGSKDDGVAALSLLWQEARMLHQVTEVESPEDAERRRMLEEDEERAARRRFFYNRMFNDSYVPPPTPEATEPSKPADPRLLIFGRNGRIFRM